MWGWGCFRDGSVRLIADIAKRKIQKHLSSLASFRNFTCRPAAEAGLFVQLPGDSYGVRKLQKDSFAKELGQRWGCYPMILCTSAPVELGSKCTGPNGGRLENISESCERELSSDIKIAMRL